MSRKRPSTSALFVGRGIFAGKLGFVLDRFERDVSQWIWSLLSVLYQDMVFSVLWHQLYSEEDVGMRFDVTIRTNVIVHAVLARIGYSTSSALVASGI